MLWTRHRSRPLSLIYDVITLCPSGCTGLLFFSFPLCTLDKCTFCHLSLVTLYPAPLLPLDDNGSIAWSVRALVQYIKPNTWPGKLQLSLLGYFPGLYETATGDTDAPSRHSCAAHSLLLLLPPSPHPASALAVFIDSQLHHLNLTTLSSLAICGALDLVCPPHHQTSSFTVRPLVG